MYRDDPLDDEAELRDVVGDGPVEALLDAGGSDALNAALDVLRILQGWVDPEACAGWLTTRQRRLSDRTPLEALAAGAQDDVSEALRAHIAAQS